MQLKRFDGGLSTRLDASLIAPNEALLYNNIDNTDLTLKSAKGYNLTAEEARDYFYKFKGVWLSSFVDRDYLEYDNILYYTEAGNKPYKTKDGVIIQFMGIAAPINNPLFEVDGVTPIMEGTNPVVSIRAIPDDPEVGESPISGSNITVQYTYTYYNDNDGTESAPATLSNELALDAGDVTVLDNITFSTDPQVTHIRIYRLGLTTTMQLVKTIPNNISTTRDAVPTTELTTVLESYSYQQPVAGIMGLVEAYGILFGFKGTSLYYSMIGKPNYWPAAQQYLIKADITGLLPIQNGIFIFTKTETFMLTGSKPEDFAIIPVSKEQGCISHKSCKLVKNQPVWACLDGYATWSSGYVQVLSKDKLGKFTPDVKNTAVWDETYFVLDNAGNVSAMDLRFGLAFKNFDFVDGIKDIGTFDGFLYGIIKEKVSTIFTGDELEFIWRSGLLSEGSVTFVKNYNNIYISYEGEFRFFVYINDVLVVDQVLSGKNNAEDISIPQDQQRGEYIQFAVHGVGKIIEIEYKAVGRENGR